MEQDKWTSLGGDCGTFGCGSLKKVFGPCKPGTGSAAIYYANNKPDVDMVNHPPHYKSKNGLETINVIEAFTDGLSGIEAVDTANVLKYVCRWKHKNGLEDLKKASWYLNHLINHIENNKGE